MNLFKFMPPVYSYFLCCMGAIFAGTVVGKEREKAQKAAGLRTFAMVSLGACVFTLTSRLLYNSEGLFDNARIPAQIVSGVGFLGAGAVFRSGKIVSGLTTAAGIWATAAVGLVFGLGYFIFGLSVTFMIYLLLWAHSFVDKKNLDSLARTSYQIHVDATDGKGPILVKEILRDWGHEVHLLEDPNYPASVQVWQLNLCSTHRPHQRFLSELASHPFVVRINKYG